MPKASGESKAEAQSLQSPPRFGGDPRPTLGLGEAFRFDWPGQRLRTLNPFLSKTDIYHRLKR